MANLNYHKILQYCKKQIDQNPYTAKAILVHVGIVVILYILSLVSMLRFESSQATLHAQVSNSPKKIQVIQATSISSSELSKQLSAYEDHQKQLKQAQADVKEARQDVKEARQQALKRHQQKMKEKAEAERKAKLEAKRKAVLEEKRKQQAQERKAEQEKQEKLEAERKAKEEEKKKAQEAAKRKKEQERKAREEAEQKARQERLAKAKAEAQAAARKQVEQSQAQSAISSYISEYQSRVGANWIKDSCRGIYNLPRAVTQNGRFIKLTGTSGSYRCDQSLIDAVKNTQPPNISNTIAKQTIQRENLSFEFESK
ncbi:gramicidin synthase [Candidatus Francisella endociliophora]|uniref:Gramicidin synthase n=1 Tax=Candidatus Francisella endociliophora TaxID=653937 RepID=A0A097EP56_9GAMM|nr:cell envelope integrity protein TolA [Francisella sp. FSC1006]AIT09344.1 gramicidin synthase [Francisella sp. FSC1006]